MNDQISNISTKQENLIFTNDIFEKGRLSYLGDLILGLFFQAIIILSLLSATNYVLQNINHPLPKIIVLYLIICPFSIIPLSQIAYFLNPIPKRKWKQIEFKEEGMQVNFVGNSFNKFVPYGQIARFWIDTIQKDFQENRSVFSKIYFSKRKESHEYLSSVWFHLVAKITYHDGTIDEIFDSQYEVNENLLEKKQNDIIEQIKIYKNNEKHIQLQEKSSISAFIKQKVRITSKKLKIAAIVIGFYIISIITLLIL